MQRSLQQGYSPASTQTSSPSLKPKALVSPPDRWPAGHDREGISFHPPGICCSQMSLRSPLLLPTTPDLLFAASPLWHSHFRRRPGTQESPQDDVPVLWSTPHPCRGQAMPAWV